MSRPLLREYWVVKRNGWGYETEDGKYTHDRKRAFHVQEQQALTVLVGKERVVHVRVYAKPKDPPLAGWVVVAHYYGGRLYVRHDSGVAQCFAKDCVFASYDATVAALGRCKLHHGQFETVPYDPKVHT